MDYPWTNCPYCGKRVRRPAFAHQECISRIERRRAVEEDEARMQACAVYLLVGIVIIATAALLLGLPR